MADHYPSAEISNGLIRASLYLPDRRCGYYRSTRFDWSGLVGALEFQGHNYFGQWLEHHDPTRHDGVSGPVEEFLTAGAGLGFDEAGRGGVFTKIGVGTLRKEDETTYKQFHTYEIVDGGDWTVRCEPASIEFVHHLSAPAGYSYLYKKTVRLPRNEPWLLLEHSLTNTGSRPITTSHYNHNFFVMDGAPTGPDLTVKFAFAPIAAAGLSYLADVQGTELVFLRELQKGERILTPIEGFGASSGDYDFSIENRAAGAGVRIRGDRSLSKLAFWCVRTTVCPEPYVQIQVEPGCQARWTIAYEFYTLPGSAKGESRQVRPADGGR